MIAFVRTLLATWVLLWSTSLCDVVLHLIAWIGLGAAFSGYTRPTWLLHFPLLVDSMEALSIDLVDLLPDSELLVLLFSFAVCGLAAFFLAGSSKRHHQGGMRGAWLFFALSRMVLPVSFMDVNLSWGETPDPSALLVIMFAAMSLAGPMASWPAISFTIADLTYSLVMKHSAQQGSGTESAVVATCLLLAHDLVHIHLLHLVEFASYAIASVFMVETCLTLLGRNFDSSETWSEALDLFSSKQDIFVYLTTKAPPVLLSCWGLGYLLRTLTQGRLTVKELAMCVALSLLVAGITLAASQDPLNKVKMPSFTCLVIFVALASANYKTRGRRTMLKKNKYLVVSGFFSRKPVFEDVDEEEHLEVLKAEEEQTDFANVAVPMESGVSSSNPSAETPSSEALYQEYQGFQKKIQLYTKQRFRYEAVAKGEYNPQKRSAAKKEAERIEEIIAKLEAELIEKGQQMSAQLDAEDRQRQSAPSNLL